MVKEYSVKTRYQFVYNIILVLADREGRHCRRPLLLISLMHKQFCNILEFGRHAMTMSVFVSALYFIHHSTVVTSFNLYIPIVITFLASSSFSTSTNYILLIEKIIIFAVVERK